MKYITAALLLSLLMCSCKNTCESFPESELKWTPFERNEKIVYAGVTDTLVLTVTANFSSQESEYRGEPFDDFCVAESWYFTDLSDGIGIYEKIEIRSGYRDFTTRFSSNTIFEYQLREGFYFDSVAVRQIGDTVIDGIQFNEVFMIEKESQNGIDWFMKAADKGIISFGNNDGSQIWEQVH